MAPSSGGGSAGKWRQPALLGRLPPRLFLALLVIAFGVLTALFRPALVAYVPEVVERERLALPRAAEQRYGQLGGYGSVLVALGVGAVVAAVLTGRSGQPRQPGRTAYSGTGGQPGAGADRGRHGRRRARPRRSRGARAPPVAPLRRRDRQRRAERIRLPVD
ncbi:MAG TPA: hypothetical protein VFA46_01885 [Actinomycetes bacterium]|nr:hypothetical protein [Actinomycetes bacterium]